MPVAGVDERADDHLGPRRDGVGELERFGHDLRHRHRRQGQLEVPRLDAGDVEDLVDEVEKVATGPQDVVHRVGLVSGDVVHLEELREPEDGVERRAELVAHARQEVALGLAGLLG